MFIVSDDVLERLICSQCKKYLSVKTINVYPNRGIKCGRCSIAGDAGVVSLFGLLAEEALFRCVNRFEGCNLLLSYSDVAEHEKSCIGKKYECPCCTESFKGTGYEIYIHFKEQHPAQLLVNNPEIILQIDNDLISSYLYRKSNFLFYINARYSRGDEELILNVMYFGTDCDASKITQMFTLHSLNTKLKYKTNRKSCCSVTEGNMKYFKIHISPEDFSKNVVCRIDLNTENVEYLVALPESFNRSKQGLEDKDLSSIKPPPSHDEIPQIKAVLPPIITENKEASKPQPSTNEYNFDYTVIRPPNQPSTVPQYIETGSKFHSFQPTSSVSKQKFYPQPITSHRSLQFETFHHPTNSVHNRIYQNTSTNLPTNQEFSDNELRLKLRQFGFPLMPVTRTTRKVLRNKLNRLMLENRIHSIIPFK